MKITRRRLFGGLAGLTALAGTGWGAQSANARYYQGPVSDHFDGVRFFDPHGMPPKSFADVLRWWATEPKADWPEWLPSEISDRPPQRVNSSRWRISYVGHASFLIQASGLNILLDPVWSERVSPVDFAGPRRRNAPGIAFSALPPIDVVLVSHCHYDHLDVATLSRLASVHRPRIITPLGNDTIMREYDPAIRAEAYDWGDRIDIGSDIAVTLAPMRHWSARHYFDRNKALWAAFVIATPGGRIFHVGDSGYGDGHHFRTARERHGPFRLAVLPIGAYEPRWFMRDQHMNPQEAVQAMADCGAELALAHHFGTFQLASESIDAPVEALKTACRENGIAEGRFRALQPGQVWDL